LAKSDYLVCKLHNSNFRFVRKISNAIVLYGLRLIWYYGVSDLSFEMERNFGSIEFKFS